jgi:hypothetical protein
LSESYRDELAAAQERLARLEAAPRKNAARGAELGRRRAELLETLAKPQIKGSQAVAALPLPL